jgi:hypothetical protein
VPDDSVAVASWLPVDTASSTRSPSGDVMARLVNPIRAR